MTKLVTSVTVMRIIENGLVGLDDDVRHLVPQLANVQVLRGFVGNDIPYLLENRAPITLRYGLAPFIFTASQPAVSTQQTAVILVSPAIYD